MLLVGCGESQQSAPVSEAKPEPPTAEAPDISIHDAAKAGNVEVVKQLLAAGADANEDAGFGMPPLQNAAAFGHKEVVELLIANGADVNIRNLMNLTALDQANILDFTDTIALLRKHGGKTGGELWAEESILGAAGIGDIELVKKHLSDGVDVMQRDDMKATSLHHSATSEVAALLIKNGANVNAKDIGGQTPLHEAVNTGILKVAELLITKGADVNAKDESEDTPLHKATRKNNHEMIELLISKGAAINPKDGFGKTPLYWANDETAELLRKHGGKHGTIHDAAYNGDLAGVQAELDKGADVNAKNKLGSTPLHEAAYRGHKEIVELLIDEGADVNAKGENGWNPLHLAAGRGQKEVAELLIANGADVNAKVVSGAKQGKTPLDAANETNHPETVGLLRKHGGKTAEELKAEGK